MSQAIDVLMAEHRLIGEVLGSLETCVLEVKGGLSLERPVVGDYVAFIRGFADAYHHGKEEDLLFEKMTECGFSRETGPLRVMLEEHRIGRLHAAALAEVAEAAGPATRGEGEAFLRHGEGYVSLLRSHIQKEDRILYPMAVQAMGPTELDWLETEFASFERRLAASGEPDRLRDLAGRLQARFRPDPVRMAAGAALFHCGSD